jgi:hypothetical protein
MKCYIHGDKEATDKCSKCGKDICEECKVDYFGKTICTACGIPLVGFFCNMHGDPKTSVESNK